MKKKSDSSLSADEQHQKAESRLLKQPPTDPSRLQTSEQILHELQVHQNELEMQNEELRRAQAELEAAQERYIDLFDLASIGYLVLSQKGLILEANLTAAGLLGIARSKLVKRPLTRFILPEDQDIFYHLRKQVFESGVQQGAEFRMLRAAAEPFWVRLVTVDVREADGVPVFHVFLRDITERRQSDQAVHESGLYFRTLFEQAAVGVGLIETKTGRYLRINQKYCDFLGYTMSEILGRTFAAVTHPDDVQENTDNNARLLAGEITEFSIDKRYIRKDGAVVWGNLTASSLWKPDEKPAFFYHIAILQDITGRKQAEEGLEYSRQQLRSLTVYWQNAIEAERAHLAREIHDEFGQSLSILKMDLAWLVKRLPEGDPGVERIDGMNALINDSITRMRRIATELRPILLDDLGLNAALDWQSRDFSRQSGISCQIDLPDQDLNLEPALNTTLFRIYQQNLSNVGRHAQATRVSASLKVEGSHVILTTRDNGRGIQESELQDKHSLGLLGLRERADQWGGEATIIGVAGKGTTVTVRIPLPDSPGNGGRQ